MTPYEILGVDLDADDQTIRKTYLELIRKFPPDQAGEQFKKISNAYELLKDEEARLQYFLFNKRLPFERPIEVLFKKKAFLTKRKPPTFEQLKELLQHG